MSYGRPQYYKNHLQPIEVNRNTLLETLKQLRVAVVRGVDLIQAGSPPTGDWDNGGMFNGVPGTHIPRRVMGSTLVNLNQSC